MLPPKESRSKYIKFSKSGKSGTKIISTTYKQGTIYEAPQDMCCSSKDNLVTQTHRKRDRRGQIDHTISTHGDTMAIPIYCP
jgi:hypothetical protein